MALRQNTGTVGSQKMGLVKLLEHQLVESESGSYDTGEQRERNHRYFTLQPLGNEQRGRSHYVSPDVLDAVESKKALFEETFLNNRETVRFVRDGSQQPYEPDAKTAYLNRTFRRNSHEALFRDGWHDAFVAKRMCMMVTWEESTKEVTLDITGAQMPQVQALIQQQGNVVSVDDSQVEVQQMPGIQGPVGVFQGQLVLEVDDSYVNMHLMEPERFSRDPLADYIEDAQWCTYEQDIPRGSLIRMGYDADQVESLSVDYRFRRDEEDAARKAHDQSWTRRKQYDRTNEQQHITFYRTWTWINLAEDLYDDVVVDYQVKDEIRLYEIHWSHGEVLMKDGYHCVYEADEQPFFEWTEIKIAHAEHGLCTADTAAHTQKTQSVLKRLAIDNQQMRNNSRYEVQVGALKNPRDLMDNKIGAIVWSNRPNSVVPLATPELSPMTLPLMEMMDRDLQRRDGYSALGKGVNENAIRYQNADSMIERLTTAGTRRPMSKARDWALTFLIPLSRHIIKLAMRHDTSQTQAEVRGRMIMIAPQSWQDDVCAMEACVALTPDEGRQFAQDLLMFHQILSQDEDLQTIYRVNQKHALMDAAFDALGVSDTTPYMQRPDSPEYAQERQQAQEMAQEAQAKQEALVLLEGKLKQSEDKRAWEELRWNQTMDMQRNTRDDRKAEHDMDNDRQNTRLNYMKFNWDMRVDAAEVAIEQEQKRPALVGNS